MLFFMSCDEKSTNEIIYNRTVKICAFYTTQENPDKQLPDSKSKVFIYNGNYSITYAGYSFQDGKLIKNDLIVLPDMSTIIGDNGKAELTLEYLDTPFTIIIVSNFYKRISIESYPPNQKNMIFTTIFRP